MTAHRIDDIPTPVQGQVLAKRMLERCIAGATRPDWDRIAEGTGLSRAELEQIWGWVLKAHSRPVAPTPISEPIEPIPDVEVEVEVEGRGRVRCGRCGRTFATHQGMRVHMSRVHDVAPTSPRVTCACGKTIASRSAREHMLRHHPGVRPDSLIFEDVHAETLSFITRWRRWLGARITG